MSREAELIGNIDEHIKNAGGRYGMELSDSDLKVIRAALVEKSIQLSRIEAGDVVTDNGYYGEIVITCINNGFFEGYGRKDGAVFSGLDIKKFKKIVGYVDLKID